MKFLKPFIFLTLLSALLISCTNPETSQNPPQNPPQDKTQEKVTPGSFDNLTEISLTGLASKTTIRVGKSKENTFVSIQTEDSSPAENKTLYVLQNEVGISILTKPEDSLLFQNKFSHLAVKKIIIDSQFEKFKKLMQAYHLKDIYRCRQSKFWPQLVDYTPDRRDYALLKIPNLLSLPNFGLEVLLAIDMTTHKLIDFNVQKINDTSTTEAHYTSSQSYDEFYRYGAQGAVTRTLNLFQITCEDEYQKELPNFYGFQFFADIDPRASYKSDKFFVAALPADKIKPENFTPLLFSVYNEPILLSSIEEKLKSTKSFALKSQWDFYDMAIQQVRSKK